MYDENGCCAAKPEIENGAMSTPQRLVWDISPHLQTTIEKTITSNIKVISYITG